MTSDYTIRDAVRSDVDTLVAFTLQEATEAEGLAIDRETIERGVSRAFDDPPIAKYRVAEAPDGTLAGSTSVVTEWSDFCGGYYWWVQSIFARVDHRSSGLVDLLLDRVTSVARAHGALDVRLYVYESNERAIRAYKRCGFAVAPYVVMTKGEG